MECKKFSSRFGGVSVELQLSVRDPDLFACPDFAGEVRLWCAALSFHRVAGQFRRELSIDEVAYVRRTGTIRLTKALRSTEGVDNSRVYRLLGPVT